ncbi:MAG: transporter substrate-binding domain-containing protein [Rhodospirillaceae bacterium]
MTERRVHRVFTGLPASVAVGLLSVLLLAGLWPGEAAAERHAVAPSGVAATGVASNRIKVGTRVVKPFVMEESGALTGFSVELWRELMTITRRQSDFNLHGTLAELLAGVQSGPDDAAIAAISITAPREKVMDFSVPIFKSGLGILVPDSGQGGVMSTLRAFINADTATYALVFLLIMAVPAHIIWWAERKTPGENDIPISSSYYPGILQAMYWAIATTGGQAEGYPRSWISRIVSLVCIYASIIFVTIFTAYATTGMTVQRLNGDISGPKDLAGKRVATVRESTAAHYLHDAGLKTLDAPNVDEAIGLLTEGKADAVVYDAPMLLYFVGHGGDGKVRMAGDLFEEQSYSIAFKVNSPLRKELNAALLEFRDNRGYDKLYQKYFGKEP